MCPCACIAHARSSARAFAWCVVAFTHVRAHVCLSVSACMHACTWACARVRAQTSMCTRVLMWARMHACMCVCALLCVLIHMHVSACVRMNVCALSDYECVAMWGHRYSLWSKPGAIQANWLRILEQQGRSLLCTTCPKV